MRRNIVIAFGVLMAASPVAAQENPFAFTGGSVKSAYIVYDITGKAPGSTAGATWEMGAAPDRWVIKSVMPYEIAGKKDTVRMLVLATRDSMYTYTVMGGQREGKVSPLLRPHVAREYAALNAAGKARFKENLKLIAGGSTTLGSSSDANDVITLTGEKLGSETVAGHKCDVYKRPKMTACVVPGAPMVMLRWNDESQGTNLVARKVTLNRPLPPSASLLPKGVQWQKESHDDLDFIPAVWMLKKPESDPEKVPGATLAKFGVGYLASPAATAELREMSAGTESGATGDAPADEDPADAEAEDTSGN